MARAGGVAVQHAHETTKTHESLDAQGKTPANPRLPHSLPPYAGRQAVEGSCPSKLWIFRLIFSLQPDFLARFKLYWSSLQICLLLLVLLLSLTLSLLQISSILPGKVINVLLLLLATEAVDKMALVAQDHTKARTVLVSGWHAEH